MSSPSWLRTYGLRLIFAVAFTLMMLTIFEQGRVIKAQQMLIRQFYPDSVELSVRKAQETAHAHR